jgi:cell division inhibitor SepF
VAGMWRRAMVYLGLQDDEELGYDSEYDRLEYEDEPGEERARERAPDRAHARVGREPARESGREYSSVRPVRDMSDTLHDPIEPPAPRSSMSGRESNSRREPNSGRESMSGMARPVPRDESDSVVAPRPAVVRKHASAPVHVVEPTGFNDAQELGDRLKTNQAVVLNLRGLERELQRRLIDFSSGLAYAVGGSMRKVDDQVFLLTPTAVEVSEEDKERLQARGLYRV